MSKNFKMAIAGALGYAAGSYFTTMQPAATAAIGGVAAGAAPTFSAALSSPGLYNLGAAAAAGLIAWKFC